MPYHGTSRESTLASHRTHCRKSNVEIAGETAADTIFTGTTQNRQTALEQECAADLVTPRKRTSSSQESMRKMLKSQNHRLHGNSAEMALESVGMLET